MSGSSQAEDELIEDIRKRMGDLLDGRPCGFAEVRRRAARLNHALREEVCRAAGPLLAAKAAEMPMSTHKNKRDLAQWLNEEMRHFGLSIRCPKTGRPTILEVNPGHTPAVGRFRLNHMDEKGDHFITFTSVELPPLEFMADPAVTVRGRTRGERGR